MLYLFFLSSIVQILPSCSITLYFSYTSVIDTLLSIVTLYLYLPVGLVYDCIIIVEEKETNDIIANLIICLRYPSAIKINTDIEDIIKIANKIIYNR